MPRKAEMLELPQQATEGGIQRLREAGILEGSSTTPEGGLGYLRQRDPL